MEPRIKLLRRDELSDEARSALEENDRITPIPANVDPNTELSAHSQVLLHNPEVFRGINTFSAQLLGYGGLPAREREILTLRVATLCQCVVMWSNHTMHAHKAGLSETEVGQIAIGPEAEGWNSRERAVLRIVDELHESAAVSDETWSELAEHFDVEQLVALPLYVAYYHSMAFIFNTFGVPEPFPERGGFKAR